MTKEDVISKKLENNNYKLTQQRATVLDVMYENKGKHLSAEDVLLKSKQKMPNIGIATVYRTLERLASLEVVYKTMFDEGKYRYELCEDENHQHHHIICMDCGNISEVEEDLLNNLESHLEKKGYKIVDHDLKFYGYCPDCNK
ncbi:Ferric uptake regulation protein FUR [Candidatus Syntrophocurvum alkaliphilum]|uniref:Ferric uptake regulation protein FUR n=1 Tax=Candidatus Syntrophocurvum alkaliphilum TaxID=2293317 RepID=A0A6I6DCJ0_9FIRM|nr:Fur family transcriptional regulator [Candidatus Syntrophocurvum alkaliphilum]QGT99025.1 Ferric uptake regulation protein FUR [Candidatus Syntrophocurvum alkaliphilum]